MQVSTFQLFQIWKDKIGEEKAQYLAEYVQTEVEKLSVFKKNLVATKQDIVNSRSKMRIEMANHKAEIIKWMFIFGAGQLAAMIAIAEFLIKK